MGPSLRLFAAALCAALTAAPMAAGASSNSLYDRLLASQNRERAMVGVGPLQWDPALAMAAASSGPALASLPHLRHSPKATRPGQRENLWKGSRGYYSPEQMVGTWAAEKRFFHAGVFPAVSSTGDWVGRAAMTATVAA